MKRFRCDHCQSLLVLENDRCTLCGNRLAFLPDRLEMASWGVEVGVPSEVRSVGTARTPYRLCANYVGHNICNWAIPAESASEFCISCALTIVIPDLTVPHNLIRWYRLESAKRRLVVGLLDSSLPLDTSGDPGAFALRFQFLADEVTPDATKPVLTGHDDGLITINIAEADDDERERRRLAMHEPYRTLLGHFRHEVGHYYWDRLIKNSKRLKAFRSLFGDERADYGESLAAHYKNGPAPDWPLRGISAYASSHPWEDWAETWAHYLHMVDSVETANEGGLSLAPRNRSDPSFRRPARIFGGRRSFRRMLERFVSLSYVLNELNRGLGLHDAYPFVISDPVIAKLEFVHQAVEAHRKAQA